jgi:hypothetical protein
MPVLNVAYRWIARNRHCLHGACGVPRRAGSSDPASVPRRPGSSDPASAR